VAVIAEFDAENTDATLHAMAAEILRYRRIIVAWAQTGTPFAALGPNPLWQLQSVCGTSGAVDDTAASRDEERFMAAVSGTLKDVHGIKVECGNGRRRETVEALLSTAADGNAQPGHRPEV
jgi:hypothetical protein